MAPAAHSRFLGLLIQPERVGSRRITTQRQDPISRSFVISPSSSCQHDTSNIR